MCCSECGGSGVIEELLDDEESSVEVECQVCNGTGEEP